MLRIKTEDIQAAKRELLPWQKMNLMYTSTGYGRKIPTDYKVKISNRWYRVYCCIFSNNGTVYIRKDKQDMLFEFDSDIKEICDRGGVTQ